MNVPEQILSFEGKKPGPISIVLVGVHGNETCGVHALQEILPELSIDSGRVYFAYGNPRAIKENKRFVEANLNRLFLSAADITEGMTNTYEYDRSRVLLPYLEQADFLLDVHASNTPDSTPFVICEENGGRVAGTLPVALQVRGFDAIQPGGSDGFMNARGKVGICIECGFTQEARGKDVAKEAIVRFLYEVGNLDSLPEEYAEEPNCKQEIYTVKWLYKTQSENFTLSKDFLDFERVSEGQCIGRDGEVEIVAPYDGFIVFARPRQGIDEEGFLFGTIQG